jgi:hypothetical protein
MAAAARLPARGATSQINTWAAERVRASGLLEAAPALLADAALHWVAPPAPPVALGSAAAAAAAAAAAVPHALGAPARPWLPGSAVKDCWRCSSGEASLLHDLPLRPLPAAAGPAAQQALPPALSAARSAQSGAMRALRPSGALLRLAAPSSSAASEWPTAPPGPSKPRRAHW